MALGLSLGIRTLHLLAVAIIVGGATLVAASARLEQSQAPALAATYEWLFWASFGVIVLTGIGNLGAVGAPPPATGWGQAFLLKLSLVLVFTVGSVIRTLAFIRPGKPQDAEGSDPDPPTSTAWIRTAYGLTLALLLGVFVIGEVMAHG
jgi:uncharacterized membrane protein